MIDESHVVTTKLPKDLFKRLDTIATRIDRSKSWIVREALTEWLTDEQRRYELTLEALESVDAGQTFSHEEILAMAEQLKAERRANTGGSGESVVEAARRHED